MREWSSDQWNCRVFHCPAIIFSIRVSCSKNDNLVQYYQVTVLNWMPVYIDCQQLVDVVVWNVWLKYNWKSKGSSFSLLACFLFVRFNCMHIFYPKNKFDIFIKVSWNWNGLKWITYISWNSSSGTHEETNAERSYYVHTCMQLWVLSQ